MGNTGITMAGALALAVGIAIQNFPEGAIISMPLRGEGMSRTKAFVCGVLSGIVEPIGALLTIWLTSSIRPALPYFLSFAAGAMIYVVVEDVKPPLSRNTSPDSRSRAIPRHIFPRNPRSSDSTGIRIFRSQNVRPIYSVQSPSPRSDRYDKSPVHRTLATRIYPTPSPSPCRSGWAGRPAAG